MMIREIPLMQKVVLVLILVYAWAEATISFLFSLSSFSLHPSPSFVINLPTINIQSPSNLLINFTQTPVQFSSIGSPALPTTTSLLCPSGMNDQIIHFFIFYLYFFIVITYNGCFIFFLHSLIHKGMLILGVATENSCDGLLFFGIYMGFFLDLILLSYLDKCVLWTSFCCWVCYVFVSCLHKRW